MSAVGALPGFVGLSGSTYLGATAIATGIGAVTLDGAACHGGDRAACVAFGLGLTGIGPGLASALGPAIGLWASLVQVLGMESAFSGGGFYSMGHYERAISAYRFGASRV